MTHTDWNRRIKRALELADRRPASALRTLRALVRTLETSLKKSVHEWHLAQTLQILSLVQARAGDYRGSTTTMLRLADDHQAQLAYEVRAYLSACAAAALQLAENGNRTHARRILREARRWSSLVRPKDKLLDQAQRTIGFRLARNDRGAGGSLRPTTDRGTRR